MTHTSDSAFQINPYTRWVYDHPDRLLPEPTPERLTQARQQGPTCTALEVDLGCGSGNFLLQLGALHPDRHFVGFELRFKRLVKSAEKLERQERNNVWLLREGAERFGEYFAPGSIDRVHINFPDPWPRRSQWKKRLFGKDFLVDLERVLKPGGTFRLKTDHSGYFLHALGLIDRNPAWRLTEFANDLHQGLPRVWQCHAERERALEPNVATEFEMLFRSKRKSVHCLAIQKVSGPERDVNFR